MTDKEKFYQSISWQHRRSMILRRDGYMCQLCLRYGRRVEAKHVHHAYPFESYPQYALCSWNLISLCVACHNAMHDRMTHELTEEGMKLKERITRKQGMGVFEKSGGHMESEENIESNYEWNSGYPQNPGWYDCLLDGREVRLRYRYCTMRGRHEWMDSSGYRLSEDRKVLWTGVGEIKY